MPTGHTAVKIISAITNYYIIISLIVLVTTCPVRMWFAKLFLF